jgi:stearoyl-CoA desaturase (delta-9 desaturase)
MQDLTSKSKNYYLFFNLPIQVLTVVGLIILDVDFYKILGWAITFYILVYWIGIQAGSHKLFSHRSWEPKYKWMKYLLAIVSCFGLMGGPVVWSMMHRWHHANSDTDKDPHSPKDGLYHSYFGWLMNPPGVPFILVKDHLRDNIIMQIDQHCKKIVLVTLGVLLLIDYQIMLALGIAMTITFHFEMLVNAFAHREVNNYWSAHNNSFLALLSGGSTLHGNHHDNPTAFSFSKHWWELDPSAWFIRILKK